MMAKASLRWKEDKYLKSCIKCGDVIWEKGLLKKGPGKLDDIFLFYASIFNFFCSETFFIPPVCVTTMKLMKF